MEEQEIILSTLKHKAIGKTIKQKGDFAIFPLEGAECEIVISDIHIKKEIENYDGEGDSVMLSKDFDGKWTIGRASSYIDVDLERCLRHMCLDEKSALRITYFDKNNTLALEVTCEVTLTKVSKEELFCVWHWAKKVLSAKSHKDEGVKLTKEKRLIEAFRKFSKALKILLTLDKHELEDIDESDLNEINNLKVDLYNNIAFCQLDFREYNAVVTLCNKALEINGNSEKALYRRSCARMGTADWEAAYADICRVLALEPGNVAAQRKAALLRDKVIHINEAYKKVIKKMFL